MSHLKRSNVPKTWSGIAKKARKWILKPAPGPNTAMFAMPLGLFLKQAGYATTTREVKRIIANNNVLVDGKRVLDYRFPTGLFDFIEIKESGDTYIVLLDRKGVLKFAKKGIKTPKKPCKILGKRTVKGGVVQLNLYSGRNILLEPKQKDSFKVGDTVLLQLPKQAIDGTLKLEKGSTVMLTGGKHAGDIGVVEKIEGEKIFYKNEEGVVETLKQYAYVIPQDIAKIAREDATDEGCKD